MFCPSCQLAVPGAPRSCPACGGSLRDVSPVDAVELVEAGGASAESSGSETGVTLVATREIAPLADPPALPALVRLRELPALAWRQPVVRAAVRTGASTLALSLALRAARALVSARSSSVALPRGAAPTLAEMLQPRGAVRDLPPGESQVEIVETFVYVRRVVRR